jgi:aryl-alcohol dehydrogenase
MKTKAAVLRARNEPFTVEDVELAEPGPGQALIRIAGTGLCYTDLLPRKGMPVPLPLVPGHEGAGVVEAVGPGIDRVSPGDHVVLSFDSCGRCAACLRAEPSYCDDFTELNLSGLGKAGGTGMSTIDGQPVSARWFGQSSLAGHAVVAERAMVPVDRSLPLELLAPLGCSVLTGAGSVLLALDVRPGSSIAVFGTGAVGLVAIMAAKLAGASEIIAVDRHAKRRELALELGATRSVDGADLDLAAVITGWTGGVDVALETTAASDIIVTALRTLRPRGVCGLVGTGGGDLTLPARTLVAGKTLTYLMEGNAVPQSFIPVLIDLWRRGRLPFDRLVRTYSLNAINDAERDSLLGETVKPVLVPEETT